ncbi:unnamed protein product [Phyllotreta striolata]|uniref:Sex-determining region Y protein n=1 Tax=Phyllotreta striolata TaxID=444603 RepID=A0A9N9TDB5_PHYSR|nr:unnamed protein product [Phyllotreta striolata]
MTNNLFNYSIKIENEELSYSPNVCSASKIPRPPNAFMLYATENRKVMSHKYPADSNKVISKKLGSNWKNLGTDEKNKYFEKARVLALEHKVKYPHYVYNPKEARLRKAMREATSRNRSIGTSPMLQRPNACRAGATWGTPGTPASAAAAPPPHGPHEEPLIIQPPLGQGMRGPGLDSPCFSMSTPGGYAVKMHQDSPPPAPSPAVHPSYMQPNPLMQLQQQTEMWHNYQEDLRPRSSGNPYMMPDMQSPYHHHQPSPPLSTPSPLMMDQHRQTPGHSIHPINAISMPITPPHSNSIMPMTPPHSNDSLPPDEPLQLNEKPPQAENREPEYGLGQCQQDEAKLKKIPFCICQKNLSCKNTLYLPLSCSNFCASPDLYSNNLDYQKEYIAKYFHGLPEYEVHNFRAEDGLCFPYASRITFGHEHDVPGGEDCPQLSFLKTDVGFVPLTFDANYSDYWSAFKC